MNALLKEYDNTVPFRELKRLMIDVFAIDVILYALIFPNITLENGAMRESKDDVIVDKLFLKGPHGKRAIVTSVFFESGEYNTFLKKMDEYKFIACGQLRSSQISFSGLISAFGFETWILIACTYIGSRFIHHFMLG